MENQYTKSMIIEMLLDALTSALLNEEGWQEKASKVRLIVVNLRSRWQ